MLPSARSWDSATLETLESASACPTAVVLEWTSLALTAVFIQRLVVFYIVRNSLAHAGLLRALSFCTCTQIKSEKKQKRFSFGTRWEAFTNSSLKWKFLGEVLSSRERSLSTLCCVVLCEHRAAAAIANERVLQSQLGGARGVPAHVSARPPVHGSMQSAEFVGPLTCTFEQDYSAIYRSRHFIIASLQSNYKVRHVARQSVFTPPV